jgi:heme exporter protein A
VIQITAEGLACERGGRLVFSDVSFSLQEGEFLQLTGPNGAGKSSLLRLAAGLNEPVAGKLHLDGGNPELALGQQAHYIAHSDASKSALSVAENLKFWRDFLGGGDVGKAMDAVNLHSLSDYPAALLSAGQKRRLALARLALVHRPLWLLDEPSVGLDESSQKLVVNLMAQHLAASGIIIAATHVPLGIGPNKNLHLAGSGTP